MPVTQDIVATYRGPGRVVRRLLDMGPREDRALAFVMAFCVIRFISKAPGIARESHLEGTELNGLLAANLFGSVMLLPLLMYAVAAITYLAFHRFREEITAYSTRVALFWAALAYTAIAVEWIGGRFRWRR